MKKLIFVIFLFPFLTIGQVNTDSLWVVWQNEVEEDTTRLQALNKHIWENYLFSQPDSAFYFAELAYNFAKERGLKQHMAVALNTQGISFHLRAAFSKANEHYQKALTLNEELNNLNGVSSTLSNIGLSYREQGDLYSAIKSLNKSLVIAEKLKDNDGIKKCLNNIGLIYLDLDDLENALANLKKSTAIDSDEINNLGAMVNIGIIYNKQEKYNAALKIFKNALNVYQKTGDKRGSSACLNNIGRAHLYLKDTTSAIQQLKQSINVAQEIQGENGISLSMYFLADIYFEMKLLDSADLYSNKALEYAQKTGTVKNIANSADLRHKILKIRREYKAALEMLELSNASNDSIKNIEAEREVIRLELKYEYDKKILEEKSAEKLSRIKERLFIFMGILLLLLLIGISIRRRYLRLAAERSQILHEIELLKEKSRVKMIATETSTILKTTLDLDKINAAVNGKLNASDRKILVVIYNDPIKVNRVIADEVDLSLEGVSSSLKKMYKLFNINSSKNKKIALVMEIVRLSGE